MRKLLYDIFVQILGLEPVSRIYPMAGIIFLIFLNLLLDGQVTEPFIPEPCLRPVISWQIGKRSIELRRFHIPIRRSDMGWKWVKRIPLPPLRHAPALTFEPSSLQLEKLA